MNILWIPTRKYSARTQAVRAVVIHTAEGVTRSQDLGNFWNSPSCGDVSSHYGVGQDGQVSQYVLESKVAWHALTANGFSVGIEMCGFAHWTRAEWLAHMPMLRATAALVADICRRYAIPAHHGSVADLRNGAHAIYDHYDVTRALGGTHWDVGPGFPWDVFVGLMNPPKPVPAPTHPAVPISLGGYEDMHLIAKNSGGAAAPVFVTNGLMKRWLRTSDEIKTIAWWINCAHGDSYIHRIAVDAEVDNIPLVPGTPDPYAPKVA